MEKAWSIASHIVMMSLDIKCASQVIIVCTKSTTNSSRTNCVVVCRDIMLSGVQVWGNFCWIFNPLSSSTYQTKQGDKVIVNSRKLSIFFYLPQLYIGWDAIELY